MPAGRVRTIFRRFRTMLTLSLHIPTSSRWRAYAQVLAWQGKLQTVRRWDPHQGIRVQHPDDPCAQISTTEAAYVGYLRVRVMKWKKT